MRVSDTIANAALDLALGSLGRRAYDRLLAQAERPEETQARALRAILRANAGTEQGRRFGVSAELSVDQYRAAVPISDYEDIRHLVTRQIETGGFAIAPEKPLMYARSSGTTGAAKYIPVTTAALAQMRQAQRAMAYAQHKALRCFSGKLVGLGGAACEETLADGTPAGATTGLIYQSMPRFMRAKYVVPPETFEIADYAEKYLTIARLAAREPAVSVIATANPSTVLRLMDVIRTHVGEIAAHASPARARTLEALAACAEPLRVADLWPRLRAIVTWLGGGCATAAAAVRAQLPKDAAMIDAGYVASEVRGTIVVDVRKNLALPLLGDVFFEFVPAAAWEEGERRTLLLHELQPDTDYYVVVTTIAGLLRYSMNDVVRVSGRIGRTPALQFIRKGRGVTNITGEKLSEDQVHAAMAELPAPPVFYIVVADAERGLYRAYVEGGGDAQFIASVIDARLRQLNLEYESKRASGRLPCLRVSLLRPGAADAYHRHCTEQKGQREAQAKVLALQTAEECRFDFAPYELTHAH
ncbi:MAG TPA: GH3 auxin-responsive promoter family protein [Vitreimonas sp.]|uniref:GH3 auxin-responsive promoter family protein n=1 Tax=Vitreimonas sp. TaxID=3069702 RepID=UPI002D5ABD8F|nr:GH3 auxin-responsive promoter family protein [Vitreimonas sp.]HYD86437.1 GH3 auxin-responsive promoter family protein [Vitreimonas sp.]